MEAEFLASPGPAAPTSPGCPPDRALLNRFLVEGDEAAFEELARRHGPLVMRVCRRRLADIQEAEDACQVTFLILATRAGQVRRSESLGGWLHGVARRVAARAGRRADRRRAREGNLLDAGKIAGRQGHEFDDSLSVLRAEVDRLPERYRRPIELCYWDGLSNDQAAERLGCPTGTLKWRLSRARVTLRGRLARVGVSPMAVPPVGDPLGQGRAPSIRRAASGIRPRAGVRPAGPTPRHQ